jgi:DNA segregation ATPase FtsK/SpoIIIE, S-DNA-T family
MTSSNFKISPCIPEWEDYLGQLPLMIGERDDGRMLVADLASLHHLLVVGEADRDRTTCLNAMICGLLAAKSSKEMQFILTDTRGAGFAAHYKDLPHLVEPVITDPSKIPAALKRMKAEMEKRLKLFRKMGVRNLEEFNERDKDESVRGKGEVVHDDEPPVRGESTSGAGPKTLPAIVLVLDDLTDVAAADRKAVGRDLNRLLCLGCPAGIYVIASAKNPSGKLIGYDTACNFQSRLALKTATVEDSANAIGAGFAANLEPNGALLFKAWKRPLSFAKGVAISAAEIRRVVTTVASGARSRSATPTGRRLTPPRPPITTSSRSRSR